MPSGTNHSTVTGGSHGTGSKERAGGPRLAADDHNNGQAGEADNVIRFPRDWVDKDKLVPFGPSADRLERERAGDLSGALSADDFWSGGGGPLQQAVNLPTPPAEVPDHRLPQLVVSPEPDATSGASRGQRLRALRPRRGRSRRLAVHPGVVPTAAVLGVMVAAALVLLVLQVLGSGSGTEGRSLLSHPVRAEAAGVLVSAPGRRPMAAAPESQPGLFALSLGSQMLSDGRAVARLASRELLRRRRPSRPVRRPVDGHRPSRGAQESSGAPVEAVSTPMSSTPLGGGTASSPADVSATAPVASAPAAPSSTPTTSPDSTSVSSSQFGGVVGSNCNPNCR